MLNIIIWNRELDLEVVFDCYAGEEILQLQKDAFESFSSNIDTINASEEAVKQYCLENNRTAIEDDHIENIFKYVVPQSIFIKRDGRIAIMCDYRFDMEHGLAVVFNGNTLEEIGTQDIIL